MSDGPDEATRSGDHGNSGDHVDSGGSGDAGDGGDPIAYTALQPGTPVLDVDGNQVGTVDEVLAVESEDVFDGLAVRTEHGTRFVDRDQVGAITTAHVHTTLTAAQAADLPEPQGTLAFRADAGQDEGSGIGARLGRLVRREHWKRDES